MMNKLYVLKIDKDNPSKDIIEQAVQVLKSGGVVAHATDTCYGLAVDATSHLAISNLIKIKNIPESNRNFILIPPNIRWIENNLVFSNKAKELTNKFWPGSLTVVLRKKTSEQTIAVRMPDCSVAIHLAQILGKPITTTSANLHGEDNPYNITNVLNLDVDLILDSGQLLPNPPSTIIDCTKDIPCILREGNLSAKDLDI